MDVTRENFALIYPELKAKILTCSFMSIDEEMTGIESSDYKLRNKVTLTNQRIDDLVNYISENSTNLNIAIFSEN